MGTQENPANKRRRMIQSWSDEDEEENPATDLLTPHQRKGIEQTSQEGPSKPATAPSMASTAVASPVPPPSEAGQSSSG
jgi:hypothetical protein